MDLSPIISSLPAKYAMGVTIALVLIAHAIAMGIIPAPKPGSTGVWAKVFPILNAAVANYGKVSLTQETK